VKWSVQGPVGLSRDYIQEQNNRRMKMGFKSSKTSAERVHRHLVNKLGDQGWEKKWGSTFQHITKGI